MGGIHLAKVPFDPKEYVSSQSEAVRTFFIVLVDRVAAVAGLVEDVVHLDAQVEGANVLGDIGIPLKFR